MNHVTGKVYFEEKFDDGSKWLDRWVVSDWKKSDGTAGEWKLTAGDFYGDAEEGVGIQTGQDARFYAISSKFNEAFSNEDKDLVVQFQVKHPQKIDCGGGYIKLLPYDVDQKKFSGDSKYYIMFGPDICGTSTKKTHVILNYKDDNKLIKKNVACESDELSHVYTLVIHPDQSYEVYIDGAKKESGNLIDDFDFLPAKKIKDPSVSKPTDWVDDAMIDDLTDVKPADWDTIPKQIPDPEASKPGDWSDEDDGEWEAPLIDNPEYKGEWKAKRISNPAYKGQWVHPEIDNPEYVHDDHIYKFNNIGGVGFELWQVKAGSIFDNIIVADSKADADALKADTWDKYHEAEKTAFNEKEEQKRKEQEAEAAKTAAASTTSTSATLDDEDEDDEHDEL